MILSLDQWLEGMVGYHLRYVWRTRRSSPRVYLYAPGIAGAGTISDIPSRSAHRRLRGSITSEGIRRSLRGISFGEHVGNKIDSKGTAVLKDGMMRKLDSRSEFVSGATGSIYTQAQLTRVIPLGKLVYLGLVTNVHDRNWTGEL